jgi:tRNA A-37 threonylcarbamoyl transferase component Bud32
MTNGGRRIAIATGAMLADPARIGNLAPEVLDSWFDPYVWRVRGELSEVHAGRGAAWFVGPSTDPWVLRHYRRGGAFARISIDGYLWTGESRVRAFAEWRLLQFMLEKGLPVPVPVAARYNRAGFGYRCDLITQRILDTQTLAQVLKVRVLEEASWRAAGAVVARLHDTGPGEAGVDHADLNAHNILLDGRGGISLIDFDRGRLRPAGAWRQRNLQRLHRSLVKVCRALPADRFSAIAWRWFMSGYG